LRGREPGLTMPTLVVWGAQDRLIPATIGQNLVANLPQGAFVGIAAAGHAAPEEQPQIVNRTLIAFLNQGLPRVPENLALGSGARR
ncbi:MAG: alpha/beta fold hydrolase, partial [Gemmatimonadales bacterium]